MSIDLPRSVKIGPVMFSMRKVKKVGKSNHCWGAVNHWTAAIKIKGGLSVQHQAVSVIHEVVHGTLTNLGRNDLSDDEPFVEKLSESLTDTLWHSPGLLRYLREAKR